MSNIHSKRSPCCTASREYKLPIYTSKIEGTKKSRPENIKVKNMVTITGGTFQMGTEYEFGFPSDGEGPIKEVRLDSFLIDILAVTNRDFADFVKETKYKTDAEKFGWSFVFYKFIAPKNARTASQSPAGTPWWRRVDGASWKHPEGPGSNIKTIMNHPAVHISWNDATEFASHYGKRLPTEAEWEFAARGGEEQQLYPWGNELHPEGQYMCNIWQGEFPTTNLEDDGFAGTAPAKNYPPNGYGLYNVVGNVWEWQQDWFSNSSNDIDTKYDPKGPDFGTSKTIKGGSYLCHQSYCNRYRVAARSSNTPDSSTGNLGFRCVSDIKA